MCALVERALEQKKRDPRQLRKRDLWKRDPDLRQVQTELYVEQKRRDPRKLREGDLRKGDTQPRQIKIEVDIERE